jgi:hypothetical protein
LILLRIVGLVVAVILLGLVVSRFRRRALTLGDALIMGSVGLGLTVVALIPSAVDPLLTELGFPPGNERRVVGVLVLSNILTFALLFRAFAKSDRLEHRLGDYADRIASRMFATAYEMDRPGGAGKAVIVIPAFNEESSLPDVLDAMPKHLHGLPVETVVVSDGSDDETERVAHQYGALVVGRDLRRGQGAAVRLGYRVALARGATVVATVDSDGQYDPLELPQLVKPILDGEAEVVHGSRALGSYESPIAGRSHGVKFFAWLMTKMTGTTITDPASGFRAFAPSALHALEFRENQFHASEVTIAASKLGFRVREVPCTFRERLAGSSKKPPFMRYGYGYTRTLLRTWLG